MTRSDIVEKLTERFEKITHSFSFSDVEKRLNDKNIKSLIKMEETGGEPTVVYYDNELDKYFIFDASIDSPIGRRSLCFDDLALNSRKKFKPDGSALGMANDFGIEILNEDDYRLLQSFINVDLKTSSWVATPEDIRKLGGALFGDKRYNQVFIYHNGADSYYESRGFRGKIGI